MDFIHDRNSNIIFSLHDSRVKQIKFHNKTLTLKVNKIFEFVEGEEKTYPGEICFKKCDIDICDVLIFNKTLGEGRFNGKAIDLQQFMDEYEGSNRNNDSFSRLPAYRMFQYGNYGICSSWNN